MKNDDTFTEAVAEWRVLRQQVAALQKSWEAELAGHDLPLLKVADLLNCMIEVLNAAELAQEKECQQQAEAALRESEKRYKQLLDSVTDYIYTVEIEAGQTVATAHGPNCVAITGYTSQEYQVDPHLWLWSRSVGRLGPAVHDEEVAQHIAHFLRASDAMDGSELKGPSQARSPLFSSDQLGETHSYFGFKDAPALQEALRFLGPGVADATLVAYYEHFLA